MKRFRVCYTVGIIQFNFYHWDSYIIPSTQSHVQTAQYDWLCAERTQIRTRQFQNRTSILLQMLLNPLHNLQKVAWEKAEITLSRCQHLSNLHHRTMEFQFVFKKHSKNPTLKCRANFYNKAKSITVKFISENVKDISCSWYRYPIKF